jgi:hypothetical protein
LTIAIHSPPAEEAGWTEAAHIYRRICIARAKGRQKEADELEATLFAAALDPLRASGGDPLDCESRIRQLRDVEDARVAQAAALAELVAPLLAKCLRLPAEAVPKTRETSPRALPARSANRGIADFIDEMIAQNPSA